MNTNVTSKEDGTPRDWVRRLTIAAVLAMAVLMFFALRHQLAMVHYQDIMTGIKTTPLLRLLLAIAVTAASFCVLMAFDFLSLAYLQHKVPPRQVMATSFIAFAIGNFVGFGVLTGGAVRARAYLNAGLEARTIARLISLNGIAYLVTTIAFGSIALVLNRAALMEIAPLPPSALQVATVVFVIVDTLLVLAFIPAVAR
ncbi:MAG TPA: YbhN family protein, partial [Candidatus Acidoferrum sp.]|nr:YbhN family protein [Candidatus Acidoferrum sp.]